MQGIYQSVLLATVFTLALATCALAADPGPVEIHRSVAPLLKTHCYDCHGDGASEGNVQLDSLTGKMETADEAATWQRVYEQLLLSQMPPAEENQPSPNDVQSALDWISAELHRHGHSTGLEEKLLHPSLGNAVNHKQLFDGSITAKPFTPARLWRYRPAIYKERLPDRFMGSPHIIYAFGGKYKGKTEVVQEDLFLGGHNVKGLETDHLRGLRQAGAPSHSNPFFEYSHHAAGFTDYDSIAADLASLEALMHNAEQIAQTLTLGEIVRLQFKIKTEDSVRAAQTGSFAGGITGIIAKPFNDHDPWFKERWMQGQGYRPRDVFREWVQQDEPLSDEQLTEIVNIAFQTLLHRPPSDEERLAYHKLLKQNLPAGKLLAIQGVVVALCISPEFVYRMELGLGEKLADGRRRLSDEEIFYALHYAFSDRPPPADWIERFRKDGWPEYATREDVYQAVLKELEGLDFRRTGREEDSPLTPDWMFFRQHPRIRGFFQEYFGYYKAPTVFKDPDRFPHPVQGDWMVNDTDKLIDWILAEDEDVFEKLLTDSRAFMTKFGYSPEGKNVRENHRHMGTYIVSYREGMTQKEYHEYQDEHPFEPFPLSPDQRSGVLTQPAWLVAYSTNFDNDPIRRGRWVREKLLGQIVPDVPQDVDAKVPEDPHKTLRERLIVTKEQKCWRCHQKMNDLGMAFEMFNDSGQFRTTELDKPVDTSGAITFSGETGLDGDVSDAVEMLHKLAESDRARQVFIRHVFRYFMGRNETLSDSQSLIEMDEAYRENNGSFKHLLASLLSSDSFLYRR